MAEPSKGQASASGQAPDSLFGGMTEDHDMFGGLSEADSLIPEGFVAAPLPSAAAAAGFGFGQATEHGHHWPPARRDAVARLSTQRADSQTGFEPFESTCSWSRRRPMVWKFLRRSGPRVRLRSTRCRAAPVAHVFAHAPASGTAAIGLAERGPQSVRGPIVAGYGLEQSSEDRRLVEPGRPAELEKSRTASAMIFSRLRSPRIWSSSDGCSRCSA